MKLKHTPGKWEVVKMDNLNLVGIYANDFPGGRSIIEICYAKEWDARLIAAAPEILEQLIFCYKIIDKYLDDEYNSNVDICYPEIANIIEKATGLTIEEVLNEMSKV